jgi:ATP-dependent helicase HrpA
MLRTAQLVKQLSKEFERTQKQWGLKVPQYLQGNQRSGEFVRGLYRYCFEVDTFVPRNRQQFEEQLQKKSELFVCNQEMMKVLGRVVEIQFELQRSLKELKHPAQLSINADIKGQLAQLFCQEFLALTDFAWLREYPRYLQAIEHRIEKYGDQPDKDSQLQAQIQLFWGALLEISARQEFALNAYVTEDELLSKMRWMIEEYRVSLFAQHLKTKLPVSEKRLKTLSDDLKNK